MKKNSKLHISISTEQKELLKRRASDLGMTLSQYSLFILLKSKPRVEHIPD